MSSVPCVKIFYLNHLRLNRSRMLIKSGFRFICILTCLFAALKAYPQTKQSNKAAQKAEQALVNYLNKLCSDFTVNEMYVELGTIQKPFTSGNKRSASHAVYPIRKPLHLSYNTKCR